jgi:hypothetical protein
MSSDLVSHHRFAHEAPAAHAASYPRLLRSSRPASSSNPWHRHPALAVVPRTDTSHAVGHRLLGVGALLHLQRRRALLPLPQSAQVTVRQVRQVHRVEPAAASTAAAPSITPISTPYPSLPCPPTTAPLCAPSSSCCCCTSSSAASSSASYPTTTTAAAAAIQPCSALPQADTVCVRVARRPR